MAQRAATELIDDLDGGGAERIVTFRLDGRLFEIDLSAENELSAPERGHH